MIKVWRHTLRSLNQVEQVTIEYSEMHVRRGNTNVEVRIDTQVILKRESYKYLESIIWENKEIDDNIAHRTEMGFMKLKLASNFF